MGIVLDALHRRFEDISQDIERGTEAIRAISCSLLAQGSSAMPPALQSQLHELLRQCAYLLQASATARVKITAAANACSSFSFLRTDVSYYIMQHARSNPSR